MDVMRVRASVNARLARVALLWSVEYSPLLGPWSKLRTDRSSVGQLRRSAILISWRHVGSRKGRLVFWLVGILWHLRVFTRAAVLVRRHGGLVQQQTGRSRLGQWCQCVAIAFRLNHDPRTYYSYRFFEPHRTPGDYIQVMEMAALQHQDIGGMDLSVLNNKARFFEECSRFALATAPLVAVFSPRDPEQWIGVPSGTLPIGHGLFLKWNDSEFGVGAERWPFDTASGCWVRHGVRRDPADMLAYCRARARHRSLLVQRLLSNHADLATLCGDTLSTLRIVTMRDEGATAECVRVSFKIGHPGADVDNISAGGFAAAVDPITGTLGLARGKSPAEQHTHHPVTGVPILGARIDAAAAAIALACRAHELLAVPFSVGWDVALTPDGPVLVEGNPYWSARAMQSPHGAPLPEAFTTRLLARTLAGLARG